MENQDNTFRCSKCNLDLPEDHFASSYIANHNHTCRACDKIRRATWKANNKGKTREQKRIWEAKHNGRSCRYRVQHPDRAKEIDKKSREKNRNKKLANLKAYQALIAGKIIKQPCNLCGSEQSEMHHPDYSKPYDVIWLCRPCHVNVHYPKDAASKAELHSRTAVSPAPPLSKKGA